MRLDELEARHHKLVGGLFMVKRKIADIFAECLYLCNVRGEKVSERSIINAYLFGNSLCDCVPRQLGTMETLALKEQLFGRNLGIV